ncbi:hypothetical protein [Pseudomonas japonica]|uniref:hypothetical protein n=1 Tax=Pseudomonas japonica TaxID=256466 RepID=UPI00215941AB
MSAVGICSIYWLWTHIIPIYGRIYRDALVVETPYLAYGLLMVPPVAVLGTVGILSCAFTGRQFNPPNKSFLFRFQTLMLKSSVYTLVYAVPAIAILTTLALLMRDYSPCPKLLISGSAWQLFWVNDDRVCFKPDHYINDNWPCKIVNGKDVCIQVDGR